MQNNSETFQNTTRITDSLTKDTDLQPSLAVLSGETEGRRPRVQGPEGPRGLLGAQAHDAAGPEQ